MLPETLHTLTDPIRLSVVDRGQGLPVVLIHGYPLDHHIWDSQIETLSKSCRVIAPDLRGFGESAAPVGKYTMNLLAQDILATLDDLNIRRAIWVGHSMGGYIVLAAWRFAPERFLGLGLVASQHRPDTEEGRQNRYKSAEQVAEKGAEAVIGLMDKLFAGEPLEDVRQMILRSEPAGIIGSLHAMAARPDSTDTLKTVTVPALIVAGEQDQIIKEEIAQEAADLLPKAEIVVVPDAGHMLMMERPELVTQALRSLVRRVNQVGWS